MNEVTLNSVLVVAFLGAVAIYLFLVICYVYIELENRRYMKAILCSMQNIMEMYIDENSCSVCIKQIDILFSDIIEKNSYAKRKFPNVTSLLDFFISAINSENKDLKKIENIADIKIKVLQIKEIYEKLNPLEQIKGANSVLLNQVIQYSKDNDQEKFDDAINQLAVEMKTLQDTLFEKEKNSKKQDALTKVGLVLSVVFGIMTFVQFFV